MKQIETRFGPDEPTPAVGDTISCPVANGAGFYDLGRFTAARLDGEDVVMTIDLEPNVTVVLSSLLGSDTGTSRL